MRILLLRLACLGFLAFTAWRGHVVLGPIRGPEDCGAADCAGAILRPHRLWHVEEVGPEGAILTFEGRRWRSADHLPGVRAGDSLEAAVERVDPDTLRIHGFVALRHVGLRTALSALVSLLVLGLLARRAGLGWKRQRRCPSC